MQNTDITNRIRIPMAEGTVVRGHGDYRVAYIELDDNVEMTFNGEKVLISDDWIESGENRYRLDGLIGASTEVLEKSSHLMGIETAHEMKTFIDHRSSDGNTYIGVITGSYTSCRM